MNAHARDIVEETEHAAAVRHCGAPDAPEPEAVIAALRTVQDPEIPLNIYDLGLIYAIDIGALGFVGIDMTLTAPGCPVAGEIVTWVKDAVETVSGVQSAIVNLVFDPPWTDAMMSDAAKLELGLI